MTIDDPILARFRAALDEAYGGRLERAVLYGSRARGDDRGDSDYDVAVFLRDYADFGREAHTLAQIETAILGESGAVINSLPFPAGDYRRRTGLMQEIRLEGVDL